MSFYDKLFNKEMQKITKKGIQNVPTIIRDYPYTEKDIAVLRMGRNIQLKKKRVAKSMIIKELESQSRQFWSVMRDWDNSLVNGNHGKMQCRVEEGGKISEFIYNPNRANGICQFRDFHLDSAFVDARISLDKLDGAQ